MATTNHLAEDHHQTSSSSSSSFFASELAPEEGDLAWGHAKTFEPWMDLGWQEDPRQRLRLTNDGRTATAVLEMTCIAVLGEHIFSGSLHAWTVIIECSRLNYGGAICIGVTDADARVTADRGGWSCGFNPYCGALFVTDDAYKVDYQSPSHSLMNGDLQGKANKAQVTVMLDMDQRQLAFSINGAPPVLATKQGGLPSKVRPWVHMFKEHDSVTIARPQELSAGASASSTQIEAHVSKGSKDSSPKAKEAQLPRSRSCNTSFASTAREGTAAAGGTFIAPATTTTTTTPAPSFGGSRKQGARARTATPKW